MNLTRFCTSATSSGKRGLPQLHARAGLIDQIDGLVRQEAIRNVAAGEIDRVLDGFVGVADGVEFFVALAHALQDADGFFFAGAIDLHRLEAALERTVFFDRLAVFARRGGADALDFAAAQRGLQDIGGVERAFGRTRSDQRVQLVDEDDGVLALHQLLHDGLEPLFKLAAVLGAGDDQRKIERKDALIGQERRHIAIGDALRQALDDGRLAHAGLADQHGIVLGAAAQDLNDALDFSVAADQRIELAFQSRLRQVAAEFREQRSLLGPIHRNFFSRAARQFLARARKPQAAFGQNLRAKALFLAQDAQQQMLGPDVLVPEPLGLFGGEIQDALALLAQRHFHGRGDALANGDARLDLLANRLDRAVRPQKAVGQRFVLAHQAEQQMLGLDVRAAVLAGLVPSEEDHAPGLFRIAFKHGSALFSLRYR